MRAFLILMVLALGNARADAALTLDLPVRVPGVASAAAGPAYRGDLVELRLSPSATRAAAARTMGLARADALGVPGVDRLAGRLGGVWFEPLFPGESAPAEGSDEPDLTAFYIAHLPPGVPLAEALERFGELGEVLSADPIAILPVDAFPNDPLWIGSHWYYQPGTVGHIHAPQAWDVTIGDTAIVVAVLDTGVLPSHPDLGGAVAGLPGQIWTNWIEAAGSPGVDDDGNGYVDDLHGWDFVTGAPDGLPGEDADVEDNDPNDFVGHGTAVAGLVGAITDNGVGVAGVNWRVRILPVRMGWASTFSPSGEVQMNFAARAILYATRMRATVINCSWASANTDGIAAAVTMAVRAGITVVAAAGNSNPFHYVADRDDVLAVAATDSNDVVASFSNRGPYVDLTAPGVGIQSTWSTQYQPAYSGPINGTSFSAPLVAGAAALVQSRYLPPQGSRLLTPRGVQLRLMESADDISAANPSLAGRYGAGRLNAYRALTETSGSSATRVSANSLGSSVLLSTNTNPQVAFLAANGRLVQFDAVTQETAMLRSTIGFPSGNLCAADLGPAVGTALFYATESDGVFGLTAIGDLPGSWPQPGSAPAAMYGPGLGDLDGDGTVEVVSGGGDGQLWAWGVDGTTVAGYPIATGSAALNAGPALSDLDGVPGVEVVIAATDGTVHGFGAGGLPLAGWPVTVAANPRAPVIGQIGSGNGPTVVIAAGNQLHALSAAGLPRPGFPVTLPGNASQDPALADLDGDGHDEIIVATDSPARIDVRDSLGLSLSALQWPRPLSSSPLGPPVLGELSTGSPGPEILIYRGGTLLALEHDADSLATFPKPGGAGAVPSLGQADGDGAAEVVAGTGSDLQFYIYDAGPGSGAAGEFPWPTARGNFARTGSRLYTPATGTLDQVPPAAVADLRAGAITVTSIELRWSAPQDNGPLGRASGYDVRRATFPLNDANFTLGTAVPDAPEPGVAAAEESLTVLGLGEGVTWHFGIRSADGAGNTSVMSNPFQSTTLPGAPGQVVDLRVVVRTDTSISLAWTATGDDGPVGRPERYAVRGALAPLDEASFGSAPLTWVKAATVDAGGSEHLVFPGLLPATRYWFGLKAVDEAGNASLLSNVVEVQTDVGGPLRGRVGIALAVAPQPSRGLAELYWQASGDGAGGRQSIHLFDVTGRRIRVLEVGTAPGGRVTWDGRDAEGRSVPAGLYYARLLSGSVHTQTRLVLLP